MVSDAVDVEKLNKVKELNEKNAHLNRVDKSKRLEFSCFRCNYTDHFTKDKKCSTRMNKCERCEKEEHFKVMRTNCIV